MLLEERCLFLRRSAIAELPGAMMSKTQGQMWPKTLALWASCSVSHNTSAWTREAAGHPDGETLTVLFTLYANKYENLPPLLANHKSNTVCRSEK